MLVLPSPSNDVGQIQRGRIQTAKAGTWMSFQSHPKCWVYTSVAGTKFDFIHITIKYHPLLLSLCLFTRNGWIENSETLFCIVRFWFIFIICPYKMTAPDEQRTAALVSVWSMSAQNHHTGPLVSL